MNKNNPKNPEMQNENNVLPFNSPTKEETFLLDIDLNITRYDPQRPEETFLSYQEMMLGDKFLPGRRITWYPDNSSRWQWKPRLSQTDHAISLALTMHPPEGREKDGSIDPNCNIMEYNHNSSRKVLNLRDLTPGQVHMVKQLHQKMDETILSDGPMADPSQTPYLPHGVIEYAKFLGLEEFNHETDPAQEVLYNHWQGTNGALYSDHQNQIEFMANHTKDHDEWHGITRTNSKPLDLDIYEIENLGTICVSTEAQLARISKVNPAPEKYGMAQFQVRGVFVSIRKDIPLGPSYRTIQEFRGSE